MSQSTKPCGVGSWESNYPCFWARDRVQRVMEKTSIIIGKEDISGVDAKVIATGVPTRIKLSNHPVTPILIRQSAENMVHTKFDGKWFSVLDLQPDGTCTLKPE